MAFTKRVADLLCGAICLTQAVKDDGKDVASYIDEMIAFLMECDDPMVDGIYDEFLIWLTRED